MMKDSIFTISESDWSRQVVEREKACNTIRYFAIWAMVSIWTTLIGYITIIAISGNINIMFSTLLVVPMLWLGKNQIHIVKLLRELNSTQNKSIHTDCLTRDDLNEH